MQKKPVINLEAQFCAQNYAPLPVVIVKGKGVHVWDESGKRYMDMMSAYSALSHGHCHPEIISTVKKQLDTLTLTSRAFYTDKLGSFLQLACELTGLDKALPMNTGAEAVETAIKAARKWAYTVKGVQEHAAEIIVCENNFHGRTTTIVSFSTDEQYQRGFGPFTPGFKAIPFNNADALEAAINENTAAFLVEPMQGEAGIILPDEGYIKRCADICKQHNVLFLADEIQTGLCRTGAFIACDHEGVKPDGLMLGKAIGGGLYPVSLFLARKDVMDVFTPGDHGSTFGGNPLACTIGKRALELLVSEKLAERSAELGAYFIDEIRKLNSPLIKDIRGKGLWIGLEIDPSKANAHDICLQLMDKGLLTKETHETVIRLAPPLVITKEQIDEALEILRDTL